MVKVQVELSEKADYIASLFKLKKKLKTKEQAVNNIVELFGDDFLWRFLKGFVFVVKGLLLLN